jgi:general secretion pathway protein K
MIRREADERGFALVIVLWAAVILAILASGVVGMAKTSLQITTHQTNAAALRATADGALNLLLLQLIDPRNTTPRRLDGFPFEMTFDNRVVHLSAQDQAGKIDLNAASEETLEALLTASGLDDSAAEALADKILDWREHGLGKRLNGAKADDYRAAGYTYGPREGYFPRVEELKLVMAMTHALYDRIAPVLTVYSQNPAVNPDVAPPEVLRLLPGMDADTIQQLLDARAGIDPTGDQGPIVRNMPAAGTLTGHALALTAQVRAKDGTRVTRTAIIRLTGQAHQPLWIYRWD